MSIPVNSTLLKFEIPPKVTTTTVTFISLHLLVQSELIHHSLTPVYVISRMILTILGYLRNFGNAVECFRNFKNVFVCSRNCRNLLQYTKKIRNVLTVLFSRNILECSK